VHETTNGQKVKVPGDGSAALVGQLRPEHSKVACSDVASLASNSSRGSRASQDSRGSVSCQSRSTESSQYGGLSSKGGSATDRNTNEALGHSGHHRQVGLAPGDLFGTRWAGPEKCKVNHVHS